MTCYDASKSPLHRYDNERQLARSILADELAAKDNRIASLSSQLAASRVNAERQRAELSASLARKQKAIDDAAWAFRVKNRADAMFEILHPEETPTNSPKIPESSPSQPVSTADELDGTQVESAATGSIAFGFIELVLHWLIDHAKCRKWFRFQIDQAIHVS
jgi:hypothetical protein